MKQEASFILGLALKFVVPPLGGERNYELIRVPLFFQNSRLTNIRMPSHF